MPRQTSVQLTEATEQQIQWLKNEGYGTFTDITRIAIDRMYREEVNRMTLKVRQCPHCLQSFNTDLVDVDRHIENCERHIRETVDHKSRESAQRARAKAGTDK